MVHWKSVSVFQSMSIKTAIFLAVAMAALRNPLRPANRIAQDFRAENLLTFRIKVDADSTSSYRIALSPRFDMRPDQSISPDWYRLGVRPRYGGVHTRPVLLSIDPFHNSRISGILAPIRTGGAAP